MNIYILGIFLGLLIYLVIGFYASIKVKSLDDYYVSGRNATTLFITGTMFASMLSTNAFMGDTAYAYSGNITTIFLINTLCACGYIIGPLYFGRYIRRAEVNTMPSYFRLRFDSPRLGQISGVIVIVSLSAYLLSVIQGTGILMQSLTGLSRFICLFIAWACMVLFTLWSGSKGVIIVDTAMCLCFLFSTIFVGYYVFDSIGSVSNLIPNLAVNPNAPKDLLSYHGNTGKGSVFDILSYAITLGIVWMITVAVSPWQAGRNLMAKDEHTIFRSGIICALLTVFFLLYLYLIAIAIIILNPNMPSPERVIIWAAYEVVPKFVGIFLLTGILSAGLSSATTFLSVVSFSLANDIFNIKFKNEAQQVKFTRIVCFVISVLAFIIAYFELASIRIIAWFASTIIAASWGFVAFASIWSKRLTRRGAIYSMVGGFLGYLISKILLQAEILILPSYIDPFFIGVGLSVALGILGSYNDTPSQKEILFLNQIHQIPKSEQVKKEYLKDINYGYVFIAFGVVISVLLIVYWAIPYNEILEKMR